MNISGSSHIAAQLLKWFRLNKRPLAWRHTRDPYPIWLSEIIMQQTRIAQGTPYYLDFIKAYPTVYDMAAASEEQILKLWQGLGYYSRARNMLGTAKLIVADYKGVFPDNYKLLRSLPGIGDYTASVILSICYGKGYPVVDGNVSRVVSRLYNIRHVVNSPMSKKEVKEKVNEFFIGQEPGMVNEALMDLGAMVCLPANPVCLACPLKSHCVANDKRLQDSLPVKLPKKTLKKRFLHYVKNQ